MSLEEPADPYGLNDHWPEDDIVSLGLSLLPVLGVSVALASFIYYGKYKDSNEFNLAEVRRKTMWFALGVQSIYGGFFVVAQVIA